MTALSRTLCLPVVLITMTACKRPEIQTYQAERKSQPVAAMPANHPAMGGMALPAAATTTSQVDDCCSVAWQAPEGWGAGTDSSGMRVASYSLTDDSGELVVAITKLQGDAGGELANTNRWLGQVGRSPVTQAELPSVSQPLTLPVGDARYVRLVGEGDAAGMLVGTFAQSGQTWFVKMTGASESLIAHESEFTAFLQTFTVSHSDK